MNEWVVSSSEDHWQSCEEFETREEAVAWGRVEFEGEPFYVAQKDALAMGSMGEAVADDLLERLGVEASEQVGDVADDWPNTTMWPGRGPDGQQLPLGGLALELAQRLQAVVDWYIEQDPPGFYRLRDVTRVDPQEAES